MHIGNIDVFVVEITIASPCNKFLRKRFLKSETKGIIPTDGYIGNNEKSKKDMMWLLHMEKTNGVRIMHARNGRDYRLPDFPRPNVDV